MNGGRRTSNVGPLRHPGHSTASLTKSIGEVSQIASIDRRGEPYQGRPCGLPARVDSVQPKLARSCERQASFSNTTSAQERNKTQRPRSRRRRESVVVVKAKESLNPDRDHADRRVPPKHLREIRKVSGSYTSICLWDSIILKYESRFRAFAACF